MPAAQPKAIAAGAAFVGPGMYRGLVICETAASTAKVRLWDNASAASGVLLDVVALTASTSSHRSNVGDIKFANGVFVEIVSGTVEGSIFIA